MQNSDFVFGFRLTCKQNHLRFSQVVLFTGEAKAERKIIILHSDFCILHFYKSNLLNTSTEKSNCACAKVEQLNFILYLYE